MTQSASLCFDFLRVLCSVVGSVKQTTPIIEIFSFGILELSLLLVLRLESSWGDLMHIDLSWTISYIMEPTVSFLGPLSLWVGLGALRTRVLCFRTVLLEE